MGEKMDKAKGHVKEMAGDVSGDDALEREGKADRRGGEVKEKVGDAVDAVKDAITPDRR